jgi:hypothetical protein
MAILSLFYFNHTRATENYANYHTLSLPDGLPLYDRDLVGRFRGLAPQRPPVPIQLWSVRRVGLTLGVLALAAAGVGLLTEYLNVAGLL